jgi:hypothetical protein
MKAELFYNINDMFAFSLFKKLTAKKVGLTYSKALSLS